MLNKILCVLFCLLISVPALSAEQNEDVSLAAVQILNAEGKGEQAFAMLQQLVIKTPESFQAWFFLGAGQAKRRQFHDAVESFRKVITLQPKLAEPHNNLAVIYNELGDLRSAVTELEASLALNPDYATAHENIGDMYVKLAAESYHKALVKNPSRALRLRYEYLLHIREAENTAPANAPVEKAASEQRSELIETEGTEATEPQEQLASIVETEEHEATATSGAITGHSTTTETTTDKDVKAADQQAGAATQQDDDEEILQAIEAWRTAWSKQDALAYFAAYDPDFKQGARFLSHNDWIGYKLQVIIKKKFIQIGLENIQVIRMSAGLAKVVFLQHYRSDIFVSDDQKEMRLKKTTNGWKIVHEKSL